MNYLQWNTALASHFFNVSASGKRVFLCVTRDTLAEVSHMSPEMALADFLNAIKVGPDWSQTLGCTSVASKAMNCLFPDPHWEQRRYRNRKKRSLDGHIEWRTYLGATSPGPPYLAYLACFVLAWTERPADFNGNDYYGPLNQMLGLAGEARISTFDFGPYYPRDGAHLSTLHLWRDLEKWGFDSDCGVCYLPPALLEQAHYVSIPQYFGLLKASDLKHLPELFAQLEEGGSLDIGRMPSAEAMVNHICDSPASSGILSATCVANLRNARNANDASLIDAYGRLLCAKYRDFDGVPGPSREESAQAAPRCRVRLLRLLEPRGRLLAVCRLRKEDAWERLPVEEGRAYGFEPLQAGAAVRPDSAKWLANSPWFSRMDVLDSSPLAAGAMRCADLGFTAHLTPRAVLVMRSWGLPFHLQGNLLEVDDIEPGKSYVVMTLTKTPPAVSGLTFSPDARRVPPGFTCWRMSVPALAPTQWPDTLPPLVEEHLSPPSIRLVGFRLDPRASRFALQFPPSVLSSHDRYAVFIKCTSNGLDAKLQASSDGCVLAAQGEGRIVLALQDSETLVQCQGSERELELVDITKLPPNPSSADLVPAAVTTLPPYPSALIRLDGGTKAPLVRVDGIIYLASNPPQVRIEAAKCLASDLSLFINGQRASKVPLEPKSLLPQAVLGTFSLRCCFRGTPVHELTVALISDPNIDVRGLSKDANNPTPITETVCATVVAVGAENADYRLDYQMWEGQSVAHSGKINTPHQGIITQVSEAGLALGRSYELRFCAAGKVVARRWISVSANRSFNPPPKHRPSTGLNSLGTVLDALFPPAPRQEGGG